MRQNKR